MLYLCRNASMTLAPKYYYILIFHFMVDFVNLDFRIAFGILVNFSFPIIFWHNYLYLAVLFMLNGRRFSRKTFTCLSQCIITRHPHTSVCLFFTLFVVLGIVHSALSVVVVVGDEGDRWSGTGGCWLYSCRGWRGPAGTWGTDGEGTCFKEGRWCMPCLY